MRAAQPPAAAATFRDSLAVASRHGLLLAVACATAVAVAAGRGTPVLALVPAAVVSGAWLLARVPLRWSASVFVLALLAADDSQERPDNWRTPFAFVGDLLHYPLDVIAGIPGLAVTGMEVVLFFLLGVWLHRRMTASKLDPGGVRPANVQRAYLLLYLAGLLYAEFLGLARGFHVVPWKVRYLLHPPMLAVLFLAAFRPSDHPLLGRIVVFAACFRAVVAFVIQRVAIAETGGPWIHATSHGDSVLFAVGAFLLIAELMERADRRRLLRAVVLLPIIFAGAIDNNRRVFWVMLSAAVIAAYLLSPLRGWKRSMTRFLAIALPIASLYIAVGWNRGNRIFAPVQTLRGVTDTSKDRSAYWREVENWNIAMSMRQNPLAGTGLGGEYTEIMRNDKIDYKEYREWPHNTVLGLLLLAGLFGFTAIMALPALVVFLSVRSYRAASGSDHRVAALGCLAAAIACQVLAWGDLGAHFPQYKIILALAVAASAKLAVVTGAWPAALRRAG